MVAVSDPSLTREQWATVLEKTEPATFWELVATLEDLEAEFVPGDPEALVEAATSPDGPLTDDEDAPGSFGVYCLDTEENDENADDETGEAAHVDANPTPEADETATRDEQSAVNDESRTDATSDDPGYRELYLDARDRADAGAFVPHEEIVAAFEDGGYGGAVDHLSSLSSWIAFTPGDNDDPIYAYTPDLAGDTSAERERLAELLAAADADTGDERFINVHDGQKSRFDTDPKPPDAPDLSGNYGVVGGRGGDPDGAWLVDIDVDDYDDAKESNPRVEELRGETLGVASAHTTVERPGHLYVLVDGDPRAVVRDVLGRDIENLNASFGEIRVENQYVVGPGSEIVCGCDRCTGEDAPDHFGRYELATERPPVVWDEDEFAAFLEADPAVKKRAEAAENARNTDGEPVELTDDADARLQLAKAADDYVADSLREARHATKGERSDADSALARAVAPWLNYDETAIRDVLDRRGTDKWADRGDAYRDSIISYAVDRELQVGAYDPVPYWAVIEFALDRGILDEDDLVRRDSESGDVLEDGDADTDGYRAFPDADTYREALAAIEDLGVDHGREMSSGRLDAESDPAELKGLDVTLDPAIAWRAAGAVTPDELDGDLQVPTTADGWECPHCGAGISLTQAVALDIGAAAGCCPDLGDDAYSTAYEYARRSLDAPLPEYVNRQMATERWDVVKGALQQLDFWHLDEGALNSEVTATGDDIAGDAELTLDPAWRDSDSGTSVLVFASGTVYEAHPDHEAPVDVLRFVALDSGAISWDEFVDDEYQLTGDTFRHVYEIARLYGAPLPRWCGTDAYQTAVLPPAEELVEDVDVGNEERLEAAQDAMGDLYVDAVESGDTSLVRVVPGIGKSWRVPHHANEYPPLYTTGRKELMQEAYRRADEQGVTAEILPVFSERGPPEDVKQAAKDVALEHGQDVLRNRWNLPSLVEERLEEINPEADIPDPDEYDPSSEDDINLKRESCPVADGEYGVEWWLAVHAARELAHRPQRIHENAETLFGRPLPCTCSDDEDVEDGEATCPYTEGWETATDPDDPVDMLIGHYAHANVKGARTYAVRENGRVNRDARVCAVDEFASDAYQRDFGSEFPEHAAWLASALREDVDDREDVYRKADDLWEDDAVRDWLDEDATSDEHGQVAAAFGAADAALDAAETAEWLLEERRDACSDLGVEDALGRLTGLLPEWDAGIVTNVTAEISAALTDDDNRGGHTNVLNHLDELVDRLRETQLGRESIDAALDAALEDTPHVDGPLADLVEAAVAAYRERDDNARKVLASARTALQGGTDGCERLAMYADDGYAHPLAHALLYGALAPSDADVVTEVRTTDFTFGLDEGTTLKSVSFGTYQILADRKQNGAVVNDPPSFTAAGEDNPVLALDATGRESLWELILGREVTTRDIHDSMRERREFLRDVYGLQVVQTTRNTYSYEGDPSGKNLDDDVELVREIGRQYGDAIGHDPVAVTTKDVETYLGDRLQDATAETAHYGDLKGSNALSDRRLAALLGCQHYSDVFVERWAALAGEEVHRTGRGSDLDYHSEIGNDLLRHMQDDQVMQVALRFGRDTGGALVFAHTAALRPDLPVVAEGQVVESFSKGAQATADALGQLASSRKVTISDVVDVHPDPPERRTVRRHLNRFAEAGYLDKRETGSGLANEFRVDEVPRPAEFDLPDCESRAADDPGRDPLDTTYTWSVRVHPDEPRAGERHEPSVVQLPAPGGGDGAASASAPRG